jgi:hypothetical protein
MKKIIGCLLVLVAHANFAMANGSEQLAEIGTKIADETRRLTVIGEIKAKFVDNKDIKSRYIRVQYDGKQLHLAGFVQSTNVIAAIERIGHEAAPGKTFNSHWQIAEGLSDHDPYNTYVGEQATDFTIWLKVKAALLSPNVQPLLKTTHVQAIDVHEGHVKAYLIADSPPDTVNLEPHIKNINGVKSVTVLVLKALPKTP